jgi:hypothetical protein
LCAGHYNVDRTRRNLGLAKLVWQSLSKCSMIKKKQQLLIFFILRLILFSFFFPCCVRNNLTPFAQLSSDTSDVVSLLT